MKLGWSVLGKANIVIAFALWAMLLNGCAADPYAVGNMLPGRITCLSDGKVYPALVEISYGSGKMTATDPNTGEYFEGTYTAILDQRVTQHSRETFWGTENAGQSVETSGVAQASAVLVGNKGTVLNIKMQVKPGSPPIGYGEAEDNKGKKYNVQF
jgi:hypothetical protein